MARFCDEEPDRFSQRSSASVNWIEVTRDGIADSRAIVSADTRQDSGLVAEYAKPCPDNAKDRRGADYDFWNHHQLRHFVGIGGLCENDQL